MRSLLACRLDVEAPRTFLRKVKREKYRTRFARAAKYLRKICSRPFSGGHFRPAGRRPALDRGRCQPTSPATWRAADRGAMSASPVANATTMSLYGGKRERLGGRVERTGTKDGLTGGRGPHGIIHQRRVFFSRHRVGPAASLRRKPHPPADSSTDAVLGSKVRARRAEELGRLLQEQRRQVLQGRHYFGLRVGAPPPRAAAATTTIGDL